MFRSAVKSSKCCKHLFVNLTTNYGKKTVKRKWEKQNILKHDTWNVRGIDHKEEELDSAFNGGKKLK